MLATTPEAGGQTGLTLPRKRDKRLAGTPAGEPEPGAQLWQCPGEVAGPVPVAPNWALQPSPGPARLLTLH